MRNPHKNGICVFLWYNRLTARANREAARKNHDTKETAMPKKSRKGGFCDKRNKSKAGNMQARRLAAAPNGEAAAGGSQAD
jgi:hypothetical protein